MDLPVVLHPSFASVAGAAAAVRGPASPVSPGPAAAASAAAASAAAASAAAAAFGGRSSIVSDAAGRASMVSEGGGGRASVAASDAGGCASVVFDADECFPPLLPVHSTSAASIDSAASFPPMQPLVLPSSASPGVAGPASPQGSALVSPSARSPGGGRAWWRYGDGGSAHRLASLFGATAGRMMCSTASLTNLDAADSAAAAAAGAAAAAASAAAAAAAAAGGGGAFGGGRVSCHSPERSRRGSGAPRDGRASDAGSMTSHHRAGGLDEVALSHMGSQALLSVLPCASWLLLCGDATRLAQVGGAPAVAAMAALAPLRHAVAGCFAAVAAAFAFRAALPRAARAMLVSAVPLVHGAVMLCLLPVLLVEVLHTRPLSCPGQEHSASSCAQSYFWSSACALVLNDRLF